MSITRLKSDKGFTIVELLISLTVLSVILVMGTAIMIQIGALFSKGINAANLQNTTRTIGADITASLQFSGKAPSPCNSVVLTCYAKPISPTDQEPRTYTTSSGGVTVTVQVNAFCIGSVRYSYVLNRELGTDSALAVNAQTPHVLWRDTIKQSADCQPLDLSQATIPTDNSSAEAAGPSQGFEMMGNHMRLTRFKIEQAPALSDVYKVDVWVAYGDTDLVNTDAFGHSTCSGATGTQFCSTAEVTTDIAGRVY